ncbi:RND family transporter [Colwellia sp. BRX8-9]|uniref:efflux RND transporter permease subunit n=1 Tax=Colwellia sp. BRX8-9 TaxID=2759831 RepID=UPI0015F68D03|nr:MMPL family transporter [Colwellia sp. BRX8-9]MBA6346710.1 RND family transporter [Colwellia sp. BRX8-9]
MNQNDSVKLVAMINKFYSRMVIEYPYLVLFVVLLIAVIIGSQAFNIKIDASAETLLLKDDKDLAYSRKITRNYYNPDFLIVTYTPKEGQLLDKIVLKDIEQLTSEIKQLDLVESVTSILNVPLLQTFSQPFSELLKNVQTLKSINIEKNRTKVKNEFLSSPIYQQNLVSDDFKTTAIQIFYKQDESYFELLKQRNQLLEQKLSHGLTEMSEVNQATLDRLEIELVNHRENFREKNHQTISQIRKTLSKHQEKAVVFLGGINMVADDMISFIRDDLKLYGSTLIGLLILVLFIVFRQMRYVVIPILISALSIVVTAGLLGYFGWEVTVISSNFISIQLIMTMSLAIHLCVRYRELIRKKESSTHKEIVLEATLSMFLPCLFVVCTTITGFSSLAISNILPIMNFGWMISAGMIVSFVIVFLVFPATMSLLKKEPVYLGFEKHIKLIGQLGNMAEKYRVTIIVSSIALLVFNATGANRLIVENSFINYFKSDSEIYQGMKVIDTSLGGTTPLDIIIDFPENEKSDKEGENEPSDAQPEPGTLFDEFENEFKSEEDDHAYWFTEFKMKRIEAAHNYLNSLEHTGKVLSFASILKLGRNINEGESLDNLELALLYTKMPKEFRDVTITPYLDLENSQVRLTTRIMDSNKDLRRDALLKKISQELAVEADIEPDNVHLSGMMLLYNNMLQTLFDSQIKTLGLVVFVLSIMFLILFRSIKLALIAMLTNIVSVSFIFGIMGWVGIPLDMMTITIAAIAMGIAVDDTVHYIHRYKKEFELEHDYLKAIHLTHNSIGYAIFYTSMTIVIGFSLLMFSNFVPTIYFSLLTASAMIIALFADLLLLPVLLIWLKPFNSN